MKKWTAALVTLAVGVSALALPASAAEATFVDTLEDNYPLVYEISEWMRYQKNTDLGLNTYLKCKPEGEGYEEYDTHPEKAPLREEYVVYKMDGDVTGYTIDCIHVNGLGNAETDVSVYLSKDGTNWVEADSAFSEQTYDDEIYINLEKAYWLNSTVSNAAKCPAGYGYQYTGTAQRAGAPDGFGQRGYRGAVHRICRLCGAVCAVSRRLRRKKPQNSRTPCSAWLERRVSDGNHTGKSRTLSGVLPRTAARRCDAVLDEQRSA